MWLRGANINCVLTREALFISQLHGEFPRGLSSQDALSAKTRPDEIVDSEQEDATKTKTKQILRTTTSGNLRVELLIWEQLLTRPLITCW